MLTCAILSVICVLNIGTIFIHIVKLTRQYQFFDIIQSSTTYVILTDSSFVFHSCSSEVQSLRVFSTTVLCLSETVKHIKLGFFPDCIHVTITLT